MRCAGSGDRDQATHVVVVPRKLDGDKVDVVVVVAVLPPCPTEVINRPFLLLEVVLHPVV